jgi:hypothetical protein
LNFDLASREWAPIPRELVRPDFNDEYHTSSQIANEMSHGRVLIGRYDLESQLGEYYHNRDGHRPADTEFFYQGG